MHAIIITFMDNIPTQILNVLSAEKKDIYTEIVLEKVSLVDNKARILCHLA